MLVLLIRLCLQILDLLEVAVVEVATLTLVVLQLLYTEVVMEVVLNQERDYQHPASTSSYGELQQIPGSRDLWTGSTDLSDVFDIDDICRPFQWGTEEDGEGKEEKLQPANKCRRM